jgi:peroxiredoxin
MRERRVLGLVLGLVCLLTAAVAPAQFGRRGGGPIVIGRGGGLQLLRIPEVQQELKMTPAQIAKVEEKQREVREGTQALFQGSNPGQLPAEEREKLMERARELQSKAVADILDETQRKRFRELDLQLLGPLAVTRRDIAAELKLTSDQTTKIRDIQRGQEEETRAALQGVNFQSMSEEDRTRLQTKLMDLRKATGDKITAVLTEDQKKQWTEMQGKPFAFPAPGGPRRAEPPPAPPTSPGERAEIGKPVKDFRLKDLTADKETFVSLSDYKGKKAVVAVFLSNRCGTTWQYEQRMGKLIADYGKKDVVVLGIHSNVNETDDEIRKYAESRNFGAPVLDDKAKNEFVRYFDARSTPTILVIDKQGVLRYFGSYDDNAQEGQVTKRYAQDAIDAVLAGKEVPVTRTRAFG